MKTIPNYSKYKITENGDVYTFIKGKLHLMKTQLTDRYKRIQLVRDDGAKKALTIHRLVAITYIPNPENKPQVNHIDGNKLNNHINNLEWCTQSENQLHADITGLNKVQGINNGTFKEWFYMFNGIKTVCDKITIKEWCDNLGQSSNYSNVKKWCRNNHTLDRGFFKGYSFGYIKS